MKPLAFPLLLCALLWCGCTSTWKVRVEPLQPLVGREVTTDLDVYIDEEPLRDYEELALLSVTGVAQVSRNTLGQNTLIDALISKAKDLGADALIVTRSYSRNEMSDSQTSVGTKSTNNYGLRTVKAYAVVYL